MTGLIIGALLGIILYGINSHLQGKIPLMAYMMGDAALLGLIGFLIDLGLHHWHIIS